VIRFIGNSVTMLVHASDCEHAENILMPEEFEDLYHAMHSGYSEARCCMSDIPFVVLKAAQLRKSKLRSGECLCCGRVGRVEMAHVTPAHRGGHRRVPLCPNCHSAYDFGELTEQELQTLQAKCNVLGFHPTEVVANHGAGRAA
jgi:hypothetical protein